MAANNLDWYGSFVRFRDIQRLHPVGEHTVIDAGGNMHDFQYIQSILDTLRIDELRDTTGRRWDPANSAPRFLVLWVCWGRNTRRRHRCQDVEGRECTPTEEEARKIIRESLKVLFYCGASNLIEVRFCIVPLMCAHLQSDLVETSRLFAEGIRGYNAQTQ
ncbi:hypothetical protein C8R43DRAFT_1128053 [Mycena crocata]|nr:hypothetical protein C8R43DRAFT_1134459 [Mycena crocata]KAJ7150584.1 hypothetical protein C8R43DRAFT_1128053 [Mycena crocata]